MVKWVFQFKVAEEKLAEFLKVNAEVLKPYWESHGCSSYDLYQAVEGGTAFHKEMLFPDLPSLRRAMKLAETDAETKGIIKRFMSFASDLRQGAYVQKL